MDLNAAINGLKRRLRDIDQAIASFEAVAERELAARCTKIRVPRPTYGPSLLWENRSGEAEGRQVGRHVERGATPTRTTRGTAPMNPGLSPPTRLYFSAVRVRPARFYRWFST